MAPTKSINYYLDEDTLLSVFEFFDPQDVLSASECSRLWQSITMKDKQLWEHHCKNVWSNVTVNCPNLSDICILSRIKQISLLQIKRALNRVDITRCIEKIDFQKMLLAKLLFGDRSAEGSTALRIYYPEWALKIGVYKATYFHSVIERSRTEILLSELCAIDWRFHFKHELDEEQMQQHALIPFSRFKEDFTMLSAMQNTSYNWQVSYWCIYRDVDCA